MTRKRKKDAGEIVLQGIGVSPGIATGPVRLVMAESIYVVERNIEAADVDAEILRFESALIETRRQIKAIQASLEKKVLMGDASILDAHLMVLDDPTFIAEVVAGVRERHKNAESIVQALARRFMDALNTMDDDYLRERAVDIKDVTRRLLRNLTGNATVSEAQVSHQHIVVAVDLAPSETAGLRRDKVLALATTLGSPTSHTAVMARSMGIPAIVGLQKVTELVENDEEVLVDGSRGLFVIRPTAERIEECGRATETRRRIERGLVSLQHQPAETRDGHRIVLSANTEGVEDLEAVVQSGAEGIGLFRSEYLVLKSESVPTEEEQSAVYTAVASRMVPAPVIIRTLDIGGDKFLPDSRAPWPREANPFLGCRSIRLSLMYPDYFKAQLRAILRASAKGNVKIMYPMISSVDEVLQANVLLEESKRELAAEGVPFDRNIDVGAMIEIPSAALTADAIAEHVKFFSIGTNDLIQYTLAVDRVNERVAYLYEPTHPAVLKLIHETVEAGHRHGIWVGLCGEMAAAPLFTPLLLGIGVDELSMSPLSVPRVKDAVRSVTMEQARAVAEQALTCRTAREVLEHCKTLMREVAPELMELE